MELFKNINRQNLGFFLVPAFLMLFDFLRSFLPVGTIEEILLTSYLLLIIILKRGILTKNIWITIFIFYILLLAFFSTDHERTYKYMFWVIDTLLMFPIAFYCINTRKDFQLLNYSTIILGFLFVTTAIVGIIFKVGDSAYGGELTMGSLVMANLYSGSIYLILLPILFSEINKRSYKWLFIIQSFLLFVFLILSMRRTSFIIPLLGHFIIFIFSSYKLRYIKIFALTIIILILAFPLYEEPLMGQINSREKALAKNIEDEQRFLEAEIVFRERFENRVAWNITLFGKHVFNSSGNYNDGKWGIRPIHVDYFKLIHGSGVLGFLLYLLIMISILKDFFLTFFKKNSVLFINEMKAVFIALFLVSIIISFTGGMFVITFRAMLFIYMGAILRMIKNHYSKKIVQVSN